jgi:TPR repeat protein
MMRRWSRLAACALLCAGLAGCSTVHDTQELKTIFEQGLAEYDAGHFEAAFKIFQSIDEEDVAAMRNEGLMLRKGLGTPKDPKAAEEMLAQAGDAGLATAQYDLAEMLLNGEAGDPDPKAALPLLISAAAAHHPIAEYRLGVMYEEGTVVEKNLGFARTFYTQAAAAGVPDAKERLAKLPPVPAGGVPGAQPAGIP